VQRLTKELRVANEELAAARKHAAELERKFTKLKEALT
jgi:hypothetical protein